ncbi:ArnT family glycosyltransferase [Frateuria defendens]|uniref:ArnT family glycosyltransferase n=1 Tax=Frateuria defendens TaxID=2219559 RepID=UPI00066FFA0D|nr:glycosyltransferase family 39 protein [Frateuria defendens]
MAETLFDDAAARRAFRWFMLLALVVLAAGLGLRDPWPPDEPRFALVARQMVESGQWLFPHRGMEFYGDKPPMLMWLEAGFFELFRSWRLAFLLPSLAAGLGTLALVYDLGRRLWNARAGLAAAVLLLSAMQFVGEVKHAQIDPLLMFWITLANWGLLRHCLRGPDWRAYWLGCFAAGLGVITKGVGVLALLMLVPYALARRWAWIPREAAAGDGRRWAGGALAFLAAVALWLAPMLITAYGLRTPDHLAYVRDILFHQTADRYANSWAHAAPFWFFVPVMIRDWFPLCLLFIPMVPRWREALRGRDARVLLPLLWWALVLVFFSIPRGKREVYLLPVLPMAALLMGPYVGSLLRTRWLSRLGFALALVAGMAWLGGGLWALLAHPKVAQRLAEGYELAEGGRGLWLAVIAVGVVFLLAAAVGRVRHGAWAFLGGIAAAWVVWSFATYPLMNANQSTLGVMQKADAQIGPDGELGLVAWREELLLQARRPAAEFGFTRGWPEQMRDALAWQAQAPGRRWVLVNGEALQPSLCVDPAKAVRVGVANRNVWWMFDGSAVLPGCVAGRAGQ